MTTPIKPPSPAPITWADADKAVQAAIAQLENHDGLANITRIDHNRAHGYRVRFEQGPLQVSKLFSDAIHGNRLHALQAAIGWRDATRVTLRDSFLQIGKPFGTSTGFYGVEKTDTEIIAKVRLSPASVKSRRFKYGARNYKTVLTTAIRWQRAILRGRRTN